MDAGVFGPCGINNEERSRHSQPPFFSNCQCRLFDSTPDHSFTHRSSKSAQKSHEAQKHEEGQHLGEAKKVPLAQRSAHCHRTTTAGSGMRKGYSSGEGFKGKMASSRYGRGRSGSCMDRWTFGNGLTPFLSFYST